MAHFNIEALLPRIALFNGLGGDEIARIAAETREITSSRGSVLFHKGDPCTGFYLVIEGQIKLALTSSDGNEKVVEIVSAGQSFGEAIMLMEKPHIVTATTLADSVLLHVASTVVFSELERDHRLARKMLAGMAMRLHHLMNDVEAYSLRSGKQRIIGYFLRDIPEDISGSFEVHLQTGKGVIASRLNLTHEHFSRILAELAREGLIEVHGRMVLIPDLEKLRQSLN